MASSPLTRRGALISLSALAATSATGCFGSFGLTNMLYDWNDSFGSKWIKWLIFLALGILPVYGLAILVDVIVLNSIEFWTGNAPISANKTLPNGQRVASSLTPDKKMVRHEIFENDERVAVLYVEKVNDDHVRFIDQEGKVLSQVRLAPDSVRLEDPRGEAIASLTARECESVRIAHQYGQNVPAAVRDQLTQSGSMGRVEEAAAELQGRMVL